MLPYDSSEVHRESWVPDNLRSAVKTFDRWSPGLTDGLNDLATHYGCCAQPARVRRPKDKALVEDAVHKSYKRIYAPLRNRLFHSLQELNAAVEELLEKYNSRRMQGCDYSRVERFLAVEKPELLPLPGERYQMKRHALLTVAPNCFVQLGRGTAPLLSTQPSYRQQGGSHLYGHTGQNLS